MNNPNEFYDSIDPLDTSAMIVTWDTGKRCNFDCAYCGSDRHDNFSKFPSFMELVDGVNFLRDYLSLMLPYRSNPSATISLTGGEPTTNPNFFRLAYYMTDELADFEYDIKLALTTNGSYSKKRIPEIASLFDKITLSYHCDADELIKSKVRDNIIATHAVMDSFKVNLMMHPHDEYWQECLDLIDVMSAHDINFVPRVINGLNYSEEQSIWLRDYWINQNGSDVKTTIDIAKPGEGKSLEDRVAVQPKTTMKKDVAKVFKKLKEDETKTFTVTGRHCCFKAEMNCALTKSNEQETLTYLGDTNFKDWNCSVNWFFLHLESQTDQIFHHQTCQADYNGGRGPIGKISEYEALIDEVTGYLDNGMPTIKCPNLKCGCGLCATKSNSFTKFAGLMDRHVPGAKFKYGK